MIDVSGIFDWYKYIPSFYAPDFPRFVASGVRQARFMVGRDVPVFLTNGSDASASKDGIAIPKWIFDPTSYGNYSVDYSGKEPLNALSVALFDGLLVHESAHLIYDYADKNVALSRIRYRGDPTPLLYFCLNLVADCYNEQQEWGRYGVFLSVKNNFNNGPLTLQHWIDKGQLQPILNCWLNPAVRDHPVFNDYRFDIIEAALTEPDVNQRTRLAVQFYETLPPEAQEKQDKRTACSPKYDETKQEIDRSMPKAARELIDAVTQHIETPEQTIPKAQVYQVEKYVHGRTDTVEDDPRFERFGRAFSLLKTRLPVPNIPEKRGARLMPLQLARFETDRKLFGEYSEAKVPDPPEVILLVDASGSMGGIYRSVLSATKGIYKSLRKIRARTIVLAHTADNSRPQAHLIVILNGEHNVEQRFNWASRISLAQNVDGAALLGAADFFSGKRGRKIIIHLSDGEPACPGYNHGREHTMQAIQTLRNKGIIVLSVSLVDSVVNANNRIYGKKFNIPVEDGNYDAALQTAILEYT
jgi:hypothetical protein